MAITGFPTTTPAGAELSWDDLRDKTGQSLKAVRFVRSWGCYVEGDVAGPKPSEVQRLIDLGVAVPVYKDAPAPPVSEPVAPAAPAPPEPAQEPTPAAPAAPMRHKRGR